jgi:hypothetical protein
MVVGYGIKVKIHVRGKSLNSLKNMERALLTQNISCSVKETESSVRKKPILTISKFADIKRTLDLIPLSHNNLDGNLHRYREIITIMNNKEHLRLEGLEKIFELWGITNGTDEYQ